MRERERDRNKKEGNFLFNKALDTFYLWLYMVKDHGDSERRNQDSTYHIPWHTTLDRTINRSMGPP